MKSTAIFILIGMISGVWTFKHGPRRGNFSCGVDYSTYFAVLYVGVADVHTYPWLGTLVYPVGKLKITIVVVLVTKQVVVASAIAVDKFPKDDFRSESRVFLGRTCSSPGIRVRDYAFPPDYSPGTPAIAMIQLDVDNVAQDLQIICQPPMYMTMTPELYAFVPRNCESGEIFIYKVKPISLEQCKKFYKENGKQSEQWPANVLCVQATTRSSCHWREGTALVLKQNGQWSLLGLGMHGPGCGAPARFVDYGAQAHWLRRSVVRTGAPAITRLADNRIIMRRTTANIQRFGECDAEEMKYSLYTDKIVMGVDKNFGQVTYNLTLLHNVEYNCVFIEAKPVMDSPEDDDARVPRVYLRRWCTGPPRMCYSYQFTEINFYITIDVEAVTEFSIAVHGKKAKVIDVVKAMKYANSFEDIVYVPTIKSDLHDILKPDVNLLQLVHTWSSLVW